MKYAQVAAAIRSRLTGDATFVSLLGASSNLRTGQTPSTANGSGNYVVMNLYGNGGSDTAERNIAGITIRFVILVRLAPQGSGADTVFSIMDRLDDLLHRYQPSFTGATASTHKMTAIVNNYDEQPIDVENPDTYIAYEMSFRLFNQTL